MMAGIRSANTKPEMTLRRALHGAGWRYRLHDRRLPGRPDLVFASRRAVLLVNGCFWHGHACHLFKWPQSRSQFWRNKIARNIERDRTVRMQLRDGGWRIGVVWECTLKGRERWPLEEVVSRCSSFLAGDEPEAAIGCDQTVTVPDHA
jgi:DNA mismatch endonuclease (patch repair protein)